MGYQATVVILMDSIHTIRDDPKFGEKLYEACLNKSVSPKHPVNIKAYANGCSCDAGCVVEVHHASDERKVLVGGNTGVVIG